MRQLRHCPGLKRVWLAVWLIDFLLWLSLPVHYGSRRFSLQLEQHQGPPGTITVIAQDLAKKPVPHLRVASVSYSGTEPGTPTDAEGRSVIDPSESEVTGFFIDDEGFGFEIPQPMGLILRHRLPSCADGLTVHVTLKSR